MSISRTELPKTQKAPQPSDRRYIWITIAALAISVVIYAAITAWPKESGKTGPEESVTPAGLSLGKLYAEAQEDLSKKKLALATIKFKQAENIKPGYRDAARRAKASAEELYDEAVRDMQKGDRDAAQNKLEIVKAIDPGNKDVDRKLDEIQGQTGGNAPGGENNPPPLAADGTRAIPAGATPRSLLIDDLKGYEATQNGWVKRPLEAGSTFIPASTAIRTEIDRILVTIAKLESGEAALARLRATKDAWPLDAQSIMINGHDAYTGIYFFKKASDFYKLRRMATIAWTRGNWFFIIEVLPNGTPDSTFKKGIARDMAIQLGY